MHRLKNYSVLTIVNDSKTEMRKSHPSDLSQETTFKKIEPLLNSGTRKTCQRKVNVYKVFCGPFIPDKAPVVTIIQNDFPKDLLLLQALER